MRKGHEEMKFTSEFRELEQSAIQKSWIPEEGDIYAWCESTTRQGDLHFSKVISYDKEKQLVRGYIGGASEKRHRGQIFLIPPAIASQLKLEYLNKKMNTVTSLNTNSQNSWSDIWPTEVGTYWFYGWRFGDKSHEADRFSPKFIDKPELCLVDVHKIINGYMYTTHGHMLYKAEGAKGVWQKAILPELPKEI
jgi:hypothetical protein